MWAVGKFVFLYTLLAPEIQGQFAPRLIEPNAYMTAVVDALWDRIKEYGISNLPVLDASVTYNVTSFGVEIVGPVSFEDGFVEDIDLVSLSPKNFGENLGSKLATISGGVIFENLRLYRDFRADLSTGMKLGTVVFTPTTFGYDLSIAKQHNNDTVVPTLTFSGYSTLVWDVDPDDLLTTMMKKHHGIRTSIASRSGDLVETSAEEWEKIFTKFLIEIVETLEFPALTV